MMNKPAGYVCSAVSDSHHTVYELLSSDLQELVRTPKRGLRLHSVGRLDCDTSGLLLFTNDGYFSHNLTAPECHADKEYLVLLKNPVSPEIQREYSKKVSEGFFLPSEKKGAAFRTLPGRLEWGGAEGYKDFCCDGHFGECTSFLQNERVCRITISEGKFHQVRRMFSVLGNEVVGLKRIRFGMYELPPSLKEGEYITFCKEEDLLP